MSGTTKRDPVTPRPMFRDPPPRVPRRADLRPRAINVAWASITTGHLEPGELVWNLNGKTFVYREDSDIYRIDYDATRSI